MIKFRYLKSEIKQYYQTKKTLCNSVQNHNLVLRLSIVTSFRPSSQYYRYVPSSSLSLVEGTPVSSNLWFNLDKAYGSIISFLGNENNNVEFFNSRKISSPPSCLGVDDHVPPHLSFLCSPHHLCLICVMKALCHSFRHLFSPSASATFPVYLSCCNRVFPFLYPFYMVEQNFYRSQILLIRCVGISSYNYKTISLGFFFYPCNVWLSSQEPYLYCF